MVLMRVTLILFCLFLSLAATSAQNIKKLTIAEVNADASNLEFGDNIVKMEFTLAMDPYQIQPDLWRISLHKGMSTITCAITDPEGVKFFERLARKKKFSSRKWIYGKVIFEDQESEGIKIPPGIRFHILGSKIKRTTKGEAEAHW